MAQADTAEFAGITVFDDCDETDGTYDHQLIFPSFAGGAPVGSDASNPAAQSLSTVPVPIADLTGASSSIVVTGRDGNVLACGEIGGLLGTDGSLVFGIEAVEDSVISGIAYLATTPDGVQTNVSLFLTGIEPDASAGAAEVATGAQVVADAVPTAVPEVAAADITADELAYADVVSANLSTMAASVGRNGDLFINSRLEDPSWYDEVAVELAIQDEQYRLFNLLVPPPAFAEVHQILFDSYTLIVLAGDDIELGLSTFDATYFEAATAKITQAGLLMEDATTLISELTAERGG